MRLILVSFFSLLLFSGFTQENGYEGDVFDVVDNMPEFDGGKSGLQKFFDTELEYPRNAKAARLEGTVIMEVIIDESGAVRQYDILKGVHPIIDKEAIRLMSVMPNWIPGTLKGSKVPVRTLVNIPFKL